MSATAIPLADFAAEFVAAVEADAAEIHPVCSATVKTWLAIMREAADQGDAAEVARLADMVQEKIALECAWIEQNMATAGRPAP